MRAALSLLSGVLLGLLSAEAPGAAWQLAAVAMLGFWAWSWRRHRRPWSLACAALLSGQLLAHAHVEHWQERRLPDADNAPLKRVLAEGEVADIPTREGATVHFELLTRSLAGAPSPELPRRLRVQWRDPHASPRVGERWRLLLRLSDLEETRNFSGHDAARHAFREGVHGAGRVLPSAMNELLALAPARLDTLRARIAARVHESIADPDAAALVTALAVGITAGMSHDQWRVFNVTGTTHLVAISGLHVTMFAWLSFRAARFAWRCCAPARVLPREPFALSMGLAAAGGYAMLAGLSVPTLRTWLMLALYVAARLAARRVGASQLWSLALTLVLLTDARAPLAAGFWLSFIAVGVLLAFVDDTRAWSALRAQVAVMLALAPATFAIFGGLSLVGLVVNLVAIPVISFVFVPVVLAGALLSWWAPAIDGPWFAFAAWLYEWLWPGLVRAADFDAALWRVTPPWWWFAPAALASCAWLCRWPWTLRITAPCALLPLLAAPRWSTEEARITVLDAGRGTAVLVRTREHSLLFDTGDSWNTRGARMRDTVLPALDAVRVHGVDRLVLPTLDEDRARGAALLALERSLGDAWAGRGWPGNGFAVRCRDSHWRWDGIRFETFAAGGHCLLRISAGAVAFLVSGDLDESGERALLARAGADNMASAVVLIGRQAGERASSTQWIESTAPGLAIAAGGIPRTQSRARVLERWRERGARVLDTRRDGAIELRLNTRGMQVIAVARTSRYPFPWRRPV